VATAAALCLLLLAPTYTKVDFGTRASQRVRLLRHANAGVRRQAALLLAHAPPDTALAGLLVALGDPMTAVRVAAAGSLGSLADERALPVLAVRLRKERSPRVLSALLLATARCGGTYAARSVLPFLEHPTRVVRASAVLALGHVGDAGQRDALWSALRYAPDDPGFVVRSAVLNAFIQLGWKEDARRAVAELEKLGADRHWMSRTALVGAIGYLGMADRADELRELLFSEQDPRVIVAATGALARLGRRDDVHAGLEHASPRVRRACLVALQECGDERATDAAVRLARTDPDTSVRFEAALVLHYADHPDGDVYLVDALRARDPVYWLTALGELERKYERSFGRDHQAWAEYLKKRPR
jgi:HEAT repeat protein